MPTLPSSASSSSVVSLLDLGGVLSGNSSARKTESDPQAYNNNNNHNDNAAASGVLRANAFTVLNADNLQLLPPAGKPNAIVRPTRRRPAEPAAEASKGVATNGSINHSALFDYVGGDQAQLLPVGMDKFAGDTNFGLGTFTRELDLKLRRLQNSGKKSSSKNVRSKSKRKWFMTSSSSSSFFNNSRKIPQHTQITWHITHSQSNNGSSETVVPKRPLFVTTVPTGIFLQPTRELPVVPARRTYTYFSIPRILATGAAKTAAVVTGNTAAAAAAAAATTTTMTTTTTDALSPSSPFRGKVLSYNSNRPQYALNGKVIRRYLAYRSRMALTHTHKTGVGECNRSSHIDSVLVHIHTHKRRMESLRHTLYFRVNLLIHLAARTSSPACERDI